MKPRHGPRGQAMVEFALTLPIFILLLVSVFDLGHVVWANNAISTAAREANRFAVVHGGSEASHCPLGPLTGTWAGTADSEAACGFVPSTLVLDSREGIKDAASRWFSGVGGVTTVSVCYGEVISCSDDVDEPGVSNERGTKVTVTVRTTIGLAAPSLVGLGNFTLSATSTMLVNH